MWFSVFELRTLKMFLICSYFWPISTTLFLQRLYYGSYSGTRFLYKQFQLLRVKAPDWPKIKQLLNTAQAQIVPRIKQLRLKLTSQKSTFLESNRQNSHSGRKKKTNWKLINQVAEIIWKPEAEIGLSKQLLSNFQTENSCEHKYSRLK